jgi:hypothetical protein
MVSPKPGQSIEDYFKERSDLFTQKVFPLMVNEPLVPLIGALACIISASIESPSFSQQQRRELIDMAVSVIQESNVNGGDYG